MIIVIISSTKTSLGNKSNGTLLNQYPLLDSKSTTVCPQFTPENSPNEVIVQSCVVNASKICSLLSASYNLAVNTIESVDPTVNADSLLSISIIKVQSVPVVPA